MCIAVVEDLPCLFVGDIGGQVGLCLGASLLTVVEFIDVFVHLLAIKLGII